MTAERFTSDAISVSSSRQLVRRSSRIVALAGALLAIFAASAQAHTVTGSATCGSVSFDWARFSSYGSGNGGLNTPQWVVAFKPVVGSTATMHGVASFAGSSFSLTVAIPSGNGLATASSSWTRAQTRDGNSNSGSESVTIGDCPVTPVTPPSVTPSAPTKSPAPVLSPSPVAPPNFVAQSASLTVALSTSASAPVTLGGAIRDTATLSGGSSPSGTIAFSLYSAGDSSCSKALREVRVPVSGSGSYVSPPVTPAIPGSYQWVANYSGDANNRSLSGACDDPTERSTVTAKVTHPFCVTRPASLRGLTETARNSLSAHVAARGVKRVTFYLDGHKLVTLTKPSHRRFSVSIDARKLSFGAHRLKAKVTMRDPSCAKAEAEGTFIRVRHPRYRRSSPARAASAVISSHVTHLTRLLPVGLSLGALALGPVDAGASRGPPTAHLAPGGVALSDSRTISRWAHANTAAVVRQSASPQAHAVGRLHFLTEDGQAEVYIALREKRVARSGGTWIEVSLPQRPNGVTGWVAASALGSLHVVGGRLLISRSRFRATLYDQAGRVLWSARVGVGEASLPTPAGHFYVREKLRAIGSPVYGPYAIGTSAYAPKLSDWPGGGVIGVHGTDQPQLIPGDPSHGCVRLRNRDITHLWPLIAIGTPIDIT
jgi:hypothetical protein